MNGYFDFNASAPLRPEAIRVLAQAGTEFVGNPSSMHAPGRACSLALQEARAQIAKLLGAHSSEVIFTSGATESNNAALVGAFRANKSIRFLTTTIEHSSVLGTLEHLAEVGASVSKIPVSGADATIDSQIVDQALSLGPSVLSLAVANGESGHVFDLSQILSKVDDQHLVHVDAAQAFGRLPDWVCQRADLISLSSHKLGGPAGIGALIVKQRVRDRLQSLLCGGPQEAGLRAGTENVAAAVGFALAALAAHVDIDAEHCRQQQMRERIVEILHEHSLEFERISPKNGLPNTLTLCFADLDAGVIVAAMDLEGFAISTGSACAAASPEPSHVMEGLGLNRRASRGVIRISLGWSTEPDSVEEMAGALVSVIRRARAQGKAA